MRFKIPMALISLVLIPRLAAAAPIFSLAPDQVAATRLLGAAIETPDGTSLGKVADLLCNTASERIAFVVLSQNHAPEVMPWQPLSAGKRTGIFFAPSSAARMPVAQALNEDPALVDVTHDLLGRPLVSAGGAAAGRLADLIVDLRSGTVAQLLTAGPAESGAQRVLPWTGIANLFIEHAIVLRLASQQIAALPQLAPTAARSAPAPLSGRDS